MRRVTTEMLSRLAKLERAGPRFTSGECLPPLADPDEVREFVKVLIACGAEVADDGEHVEIRWPGLGRKGAAP